MQCGLKLFGIFLLCDLYSYMLKKIAKAAMQAATELQLNFSYSLQNRHHLRSHSRHLQVRYEVISDFNYIFNHTEWNINFYFIYIYK